MVHQNKHFLMKEEALGLWMKMRDAELYLKVACCLQFSPACSKITRISCSNKVED